MVVQERTPIIRLINRLGWIREHKIPQALLSEKIDGGYPKACTVNVIYDLTSVEIAKTARRAAKRSVRIMVMVC